MKNTNKVLIEDQVLSSLVVDLFSFSKRCFDINLYDDNVNAHEKIVKLFLINNGLKFVTIKDLEKKLDSIVASAKEKNGETDMDYNILKFLKGGIKEFCPSKKDINKKKKVDTSDEDSIEDESSGFDLTGNNNSDYRKNTSFYSLHSYSSY